MMPKHPSADANAVSAPAPPGSEDETLKAKNTKKPKGWKKWKRRLSRVFKGKKTTKEHSTNGQTHPKSAQHPERARDLTDHKLSLEEEPHYDDDDDDDGTDESPAAFEKEVDPQRHYDSREWRRSGRSEQSSYVSERGEDWEEDDAAEYELEDNGEEYEDEEDLDNEVPHAVEPEEAHHVEEGAVGDGEDVEYEDADQQLTPDVQDPQTDEYVDQEVEHEDVVAEDEYEEVYEEDLEVSAELQGSVVSDYVGPASLDHSSGEGSGHVDDEQHQLTEEEEEDDEEDEEDEEEEGEEEHGGVNDDEEQLHGGATSVNYHTEVSRESVDLATPSSGTADEQEHGDPEQNDENECGGDDEETRLVEAADLHLELSDDLQTADHEQVASIPDGSTGLASPQEDTSDSNRSEVDTEELTIGPAVVTEIVVASAPELSPEQHKELAAIVALIPPHLSLVRDVSAWCVAHTAITPVASTECQLFLLSVQSGKWKLAELLADKLRRDHARPMGSPQDDQVIAAILAQCAA